MDLRKRIPALLLVFLTLATPVIPTNSLCSPLCEQSGWSDCMPGQTMRRLPTLCIFCHDADVIVTGTPVPVGPCVLEVPQHLSIRGHPFGVLSAEKLSAFNHSSVQTLVLVHGGIKDVEENTFNGFLNLHTLGLDSNRLTRVRQIWLAGLTELVELRLMYNRIAHIDPGCFSNLRKLNTLKLEGNLLQHIDPAWFHGLHALTMLELGENEIRSAPPGAFHELPSVDHIYLERNHFSCLDRELLLGMGDLSTFYVGGHSLMTISDDVPQRMAWSLDISSSGISLSLAAFSFCVTTDQERHERSLQWRAQPAGSLFFPMSCMFSTDVRDIDVLPPFVVLATDEKLGRNATDQCRRVWEHNRGVTVDLKGNSSFQLVSMGVGNTSVALLLFNTQDTHTVSRTDHGIINTTYASTSHAKNITCVLVSAQDPSPLLFTIPLVPRKPTVPCPVHDSDTDPVRVLTSKPSRTTEEYRLENEATVAYMSTPQARTLTSNHEQGATEPEAGFLIPVVVVSIVVVAGVLLVLFSVGCLLKLRHARLQATVETNDAHAGETPGLVPCRTLPTGLCTVSHMYSEIPDNIAAAQRPLPALPHTYAEIPDHIAAAQRPLPTLPSTSLRPVRPTDCDSLEDEPITPYAAAAEPSLPVVTKSRQNQRMYDIDGVHSIPGRLAATYRVPRESWHHCVTTYGNPCTYWPRVIIGDGTQNTPRRASLPLVTLPNTYWPWEIVGEGTRNTPRRASLPLTLPNTYWPWKISGEGSRNTQRPSSLSTLPNTYWPWEIAGKGTRNTPRRASLSTLPNTYWP
ncbi:LRRTM3 [Branchiostoma lanceolatum]|uniref:LRRTM3 protein n=1 Tax=Branchiostoma lanceolatum TaxID=7740 RepID=A0A8J9YL60_BRALA|nr:LRRTM3 [Branchiostoma lanceolatum]